MDLLPGTGYIPTTRTVALTILGHEEYRDVANNGEGFLPVEGTETAFLLLKVPGESNPLRVQIPHKNLDPILALMFSDFGGPIEPEASLEAPTSEHRLVPCTGRHCTRGIPQECGWCGGTGRVFTKVADAIARLEPVT